MRLSKYPSNYITGEITIEMIIDINLDYHLIVILQNTRLLNLFYMCKGGNLDIVNFMIYHGYYSAREWNLALYWMCMNNHIDVAYLLCDDGCDIYIQKNWIPDDMFNIIIKSSKRK